MQSHFTIGIPVCNGMPFLPETMESVLRQSRADFEILVINDGSTDDSRAYLESIRDPRLRILSQENCGLTATLNRMLAETKTPWLVRLDADDIACPDRMALVMEYAENYPEAGLFYSRAKHHQHGKAISLSRTTEGTPADLRKQTEEGYLLAICHSTVVLNVRKARELGGYRFDLHIEDLDLWWRMALAHDLRLIPEITVAYRLNSASVCASNLRTLSRNTLYAQYLLLSHLWRQPARGYEELQGTLDRMLSERKLRYREQMWNAAIDIGAREYPAAVRHLAVAAVHAPERFLQRAAYPFRKEAQIRVGEPPELFRKWRGRLWAANSVIPFVDKAS